jgi:hypothetical protein
MTEGIFLAVCLVYLALVVLSGIVAARNDRKQKLRNAELNAAMRELAQVVDARHRQVYGRSSTILTEAQKTS